MHEPWYENNYVNAIVLSLLGYGLSAHCVNDQEIHWRHVGRHSIYSTCWETKRRDEFMECVEMPMGDKVN